MTEFWFYFIDCQRSLEVVMIEIKSSSLLTTSMKCYVSDVPMRYGFVCKTDNTTLPGKIYFRRTHGRFFLFELSTYIGNMSFKVYTASIEEQNGEPCLESIDVDDEHTAGSQITVSSAHPKQILSRFNDSLTSWIHDFTDMTPWILVDLFTLTTIEGIGIYFPKDWDTWTAFSFYYGTSKDELQLYKDMEFRMSPSYLLRHPMKMFTFPRPIKTTYVKFNKVLENPANKSRCLTFKLFGCKLTRITDINSGSLSELVPLKQELRSGDSYLIGNISVEECKSLCSSDKSCSVANINEDRLCQHYKCSQLGIWKHSMIANGSQWFTKLHNYVHLMVFPRANNPDGSFFGNVQYVHTDSIIASLSYPFKTILDRDIQWIVNFEPRQFAKLVFTNLTLSECALIVKTSQESNSIFAIDDLFNEEVFVIETNKNLLFLSTISKTILSPTIKFRAIVTAEDKRIWRSGFAIKDADGEHEFCSTFPPPETYKSKSSEINIYFRVLHGVQLNFGLVRGQDEGFRIQYRISDHSLQRYTNDEEEYGSSGVYACSERFRKCYTVFSKEVSWDIANTECIEHNEHLVTVTSSNEMNYVQYLLRSRLYQQNRTEENEAADKQKFLGAHI
ncbi:uncharacterized protein LOC132742717, partial [Ruditapes philippinarum]|uniref:uncharacterized protein LOC132742717 n=1 Tax=Ruditapes philippinarum TaxID=129788 RepID=UPI00295BC9F1